MKDQPLKIEIKNDQLVISVGISAFAFATQAADAWPDNEVIVDESQFAKDIVHELQREDEQGSTPLHFLFDSLAQKALEQGSIAVATKPE